MKASTLAIVPALINIRRCGCPLRALTTETAISKAMSFVRKTESTPTAHDDHQWRDGDTQADGRCLHRITVDRIKWALRSADASLGFDDAAAAPGCHQPARHEFSAWIKLRKINTRRPL
jgi:hypothetical protein